MNLVYGPVTSLRYGNVMGINPLGTEKVCSFNCVYCNLGPSIMTMNKIRKEHIFPSIPDLQDAFRKYIVQSVPIDNIVISGNGEPTLYPEFEAFCSALIELRNEHLPQTKIAVLSNGAHLDSKKVVQGLNLVDERVIKIDAGNDSLMAKVNDPLVRITLAKILSGIGKLNDVTTQSLFFTGDVDNTQAEIIDDWIEVIGLIKPRKVQIMTLTDPSPGKINVNAVEEDTLYSIAFKLKKRTGADANVYYR